MLVGTIERMNYGLPSAPVRTEEVVMSVNHVTDQSDEPSFNLRKGTDQSESHLMVEDLDDSQHNTRTPPERKLSVTRRKPSHAHSYYKNFVNQDEIN